MRMTTLEEINRKDEEKLDTFTKTCSTEQFVKRECIDSKPVLETRKPRGEMTKTKTLALNS